MLKKFKEACEKCKRKPVTWNVYVDDNMISLLIDRYVYVFVKDGSLEDDSYESDATRLAIRNYIENKHEDSIEPTVKQIQSRMKGTTLTSQEIIDIVEELGFEVEYNKPALSRSRVVVGEDIHTAIDPFTD